MMKYFYTLTTIIAAFLLYQIVNIIWYNAKIDTAPAQYVIGDPDSDDSIVEFLSFNCPYCKQIHPTILSALERNPAIKYVPRPIGAKGDIESVKKAALAYSAGNQGKFKEVFDDLFARYRPIDDDFIKELADKHGLDKDQLTTDMNSQKTKDLINKNNNLFLEANANATPTFIIGRKLFYIPVKQMPTTQDFLNMLENAKKM